MPRAAPGGRREVGLPQQHVRLGEARIQHRVVLRVCRRRELRWSPRCRIACRYWDGSTPRPLALRGEAAPTLADSPPNRPEETSLARRGAGACPRLSRPRPCPASLGQFCTLLTYGRFVTPGSSSSARW